MTRRIVGLALILAACAAAPASGASLGAAWQLDEGAGAIASDASGNGNAGAITGAAWTAGRFDDGLGFDGSGDAVRVPRSASLTPPQAVTVEAWVRAPESPGKFRHIASTGANQCLAAAYGLYTGIDGTAGFYVRNAMETFTISPLADASVWDGEWHHLAGTYDGTTSRLFVDGAEVGAGTAGVGGPIDYSSEMTSDFLLGLYGDACGDHLEYKGDLDEVRVWDRAMDAGEVAASTDMGDGSADDLDVSGSGDDQLVYTEHFDDPDEVTISLESASGTLTIDDVSIHRVLPIGTASCGRLLDPRCEIDLRNGGRTADLRVHPGIDSILDGDALLRVRLSNGESVYAEVELR